MSKTMKIIMLVSVIVNILLIGFIIGNVSHRFFIDNSIREKPPEFSMNLSPEKKELFRSTMEKVRADNRTLHKQIRESRRKIFSILNAPQFDEASYESEIKKLHKLRGLMMKRLSDATKGLAKQLNQEERRTLAEHLKQLPRPHREKRHPYKSGIPPEKPLP